MTPTLTPIIPKQEITPHTRAWVMRGLLPDVPFRDFYRSLVLGHDAEFRAALELLPDGGVRKEQIRAQLSGGEG